VLEAIHAVYGI